MLALGLTGASGAAADSTQANLVDLSLQRSTPPPVGGGVLMFGVLNAGPDNAAAPIQLDLLLIHTRAATVGLPDGCGTLGGSPTRGAPLVHCMLDDTIPAGGAVDVSIPLAGSGSGLALVHVWPGARSGDVETNPLNNQAVFRTS